jgi:peptide/nickel transport system permease protein
VGVAKLILRRIAFGAITLFVVSVLVFLLTQSLGDPARAILGRDAQIPEALQAKRLELGLDRPVVNQYFGWLGGIVRGDPGESYTNGKPIIDFIGDRMRNSLFLMFCASIVAIPLSLLIGAYSAVRRDKAFDTGSSYAMLTLAAVPEFVIGTILVVVFSVTFLHVLPAVSAVRGNTEPWDDMAGIVLPVVTLTLIVMPYLVRSFRASMVEVLDTEYIETARLNGLSSRTIVWRQALPNTIGSTVQVIALGLAYMGGGVVIVEKVFNYPGIGTALVDAITTHDVPVVQFISILIATLYIVCNTVADVGTIVLTPRLRTGLT